MPGSGIIFPSTIYRDSGAVLFVGAPEGSDTTSGTGPYTYNDINQALFVGAPDGSDVLTHPGQVFYDSGQAVALFAPYLYQPSVGPFTYNDSGQVVLVEMPMFAGRAFYADFSQVSQLVGVPQGSDTYVPARTPNKWFDFGTSVFVGVTQGSDSSVLSDRSGALIVGKPSGHDTVVLQDSESAKAVGAPQSRNSTWRHSAGSSLLVGDPSGIDRFKGKDNGQSLVIGHPSGSDSATFADRSKSLAWFAPQTNAVAFTSSDTGQSKLVGKPQFSGHFTAHDSASVLAIGSPLGRDKAKARDSAMAIIIGAPSGSQVYKHFDKGTALVVVKTQGADHSVYSDMASSAIVGKSALGANAANASGIIPAIRYWIKNTISGLTQIQEALSSETVLQDLVAPFAVIAASKPTRIQLAVQDQAYSIAFDLIYVKPEDAGVDNPPEVRSTMRLLEMALLADYQLKANTSIPSCFNLNVTATPYDRLNEYNSQFARSGQPIEVGVTTIIVDYIEFNLGQ